MARTATPAQIKRAWRIRAFRTHPDRGGDPAEFKRVYAAYQYITNHQSDSTGSSHDNHQMNDSEWNIYAQQAEIYADAWRRVPSGIRIACDVVYPIWIALVVFAAWPGTAGGALFLLCGIFGASERDTRVGVLMLCVGLPLTLSIVFDWWGKLRYALMDYYSRMYMRRLA